VRGTKDLLPEALRQHTQVIETARDVCEKYGFFEMSTPIFEFTKVFTPVGESSDIISKETYTFEDRNGESLTLRPEGTAAIARAVVSEGLSQNAPLKYFYEGPMFRYDRPQKGRYRQFTQIGVELIGAAQSQADVETIASGYQVLRKLGLADKVVLEVNSLGDKGSREVYKSILVEYLQDYKESLSQESQDRLIRNPLRILDSKNEGDKKIVEGAPSYQDSLNQESKDFFGEVLGGLDTLKIPYKVNPKLVRGLDYYCHTAFEFISIELGAQGTVLAGGRYDGLVKALGGPDLAGVGWAGGVERLVLLSGFQIPAPRPIVVIPMGEEQYKVALWLSQLLREKGLYVDQGYSGNTSKRLKKADKLNAEYVIIIGEEELKQHSVIVRNLDSGIQELVHLNSIGSYFNKGKKNEHEQQAQSSSSAS